MDTDNNTVVKVYDQSAAAELQCRLGNSLMYYSMATLSGKFRAVAVLLLLLLMSTLLVVTSSDSDTQPQHKQQHKQKQQQQPNVVILFADNLAYDDVGTFQTTSNGSKPSRTPRTDQLATEGLKLLNWNSPAVLCSASRAALLTGKYPSSV